MIKLTDYLWVGDSVDEMTAEVDVILNVARNLKPTRGWPKIEYVHVGLVDGPGNMPCAYRAAIFELASMMHRGKRVLICCHEGRSRSLAVAIMYLATLTDHTWDEQVEILQERIEGDLPIPHSAHRAAFLNMNRRVLLNVMEN